MVCSDVTHYRMLETTGTSWCAIMDQGECRKLHVTCYMLHVYVMGIVHVDVVSVAISYMWML